MKVSALLGSSCACSLDHSPAGFSSPFFSIISPALVEIYPLFTQGYLFPLKPVLLFSLILSLILTDLPSYSFFTLEDPPPLTAGFSASILPIHDFFT